MARFQADKIMHGSSRFLSLEYAGYGMAVLLALLFTIEAVKAVFSLWNSDIVHLQWPANVIIGVPEGYVGAVTAGVAALLLSFIALALSSRLSKGFSERMGYEGRTAYRLVSYAVLAIAGFIGLMTLMTLLGILISSLLLIGSDSSIVDLFLLKFLPGLIALLLAGVTAWYLFRTVKGEGLSRKLPLLLAAVSGAVLLALIVTVAVQAHDGYSENDFSRLENTLDSPDLQGIPFYYR